MESPTDATLTNFPQDGKKTAPFRIPPEGAAILEQVFFKEGITHPSKELREELVRRIQALPGCEAYRMNTLQNWFNHRRTMAKRKGSGNYDAAGPDDPSESSESSLRLKIKIPKAQRNPKLKLTHYPSIKPTALSQLTTLVTESPYPSQQLMSTWAQLLKADQKDIEGWVRAQQARIVENTIGVNTPVEEEEEEDDEALSAIYNTSLPLPISSGIPVSSFNSPLSATLPSTSSLFAPIQLHNPPPPPPSEQLLLAIGSKLNVPVDATLEPTEHPKSASDFATLFKSYQVDMENILSVVDNTKKVKKREKEVLEMWGFPVTGRRPA